MVAREDVLAQQRSGLFRIALRFCQSILGFRFRDLVGVVGAVEGGEAFEVSGCPGMFALKELIDFALGGGTAVYGGGVGFFGLADARTGFADTVLCLGVRSVSSYSNEKQGVV